MQQRRLLIFVSALILSILMFFCTSALYPPPVASAHAFVIGSNPVDGATINAAPNVVRIYFNAPVSTLSTVHVYAIENGQLVDVSAAPASISPTDARELDTPLKSPGSLPQGSYEIKWMAVASNDGHTTYGVIGFDVGYSSMGLPGTTTLGPTTSNNLDGAGGIRTLNFLGVLSIIWDWLILGALTLWVGMLVIEKIIVARTERVSDLLRFTLRPGHSLHWLCLSALLCGEVVALVLRNSRLSQALDSGFNLSNLLRLVSDTTYGHIWLARIVLLLIGLGFLYWLKQTADSKDEDEAGNVPAPRPLQRSSSGRQSGTQEFHPTTGSLTRERVEMEEKAASRPLPPYTFLWLILTGLLLLTYALTGNASQVFRPHISAIIFDWLYLTAQGIWFGGLAYLGYMLLPRLPGDLDRQSAPLIELLQRILPVFLAAMCILLISGFFLAEASITSIDRLLNDPYGRTLLVQSAVTVLILLLSLYTLFVLRPRITRQVLLLPVVEPELPARRMRQSALEQSWRTLKGLVNTQAIMGAGVLLCAAFMTFYAPPIVFPNINYAASSSSPSASSTGSTQSKQVGDLHLTLNVLPGKLNRENSVVLLITDSNGNPITDAKVSLSTNMVIMNMGTAHKTIESGNPLYVATFDKRQAFSMAGQWSIDLTIQRPGHDSVQTRFLVMLQSA
ncbi:hypothetical protein EPA93_29460 [Ktedonosporobacter rubrisoli]|uniref:Copper resistance protein CopC n=1 Tax=Ktedonosporobacter rubrisoli TaxID=2509675 RepID=A0A4P6JWN9_KTERU|nr:copper resistance protein CopC [Ktedonosporobacter rubrisoli]QBD79885.1 hypothetical protein EPA93_29460 [Ktedonosporobacter rubrisoli]